jgi:hypothetical protein
VTYCISAATGQKSHLKSNNNNNNNNNNSIRLYLRANLTAQRPITKLARAYNNNNNNNNNINNDFLDFVHRLKF